MHSPRCSDSPTLALVMLHNGSQLAVAYGDDLVVSVRQALLARLAALAPTVIAIEQGFLLPLCDHSVAWLEHLLLACSYEPIRHDGAQVLPVLSAAFTCSAAAPAIERCGPGEIAALPAAQYQAAWRARYRRDMACAVDFIRHLQAGQVSLVYQPIRNIDRHTPDLYQEALLRIDVFDDGALRGGLQHIETLERLGLVRLLDHCVVHTAIHALRADPMLRLGCNLSAHSATLDAWWSGALATLGREPDIAQRLTLELTETAAPGSGQALPAFISRLQRLGCRVVLDDFGAGCSGLGLLLGLRFDAVKLDKRFLHAARLGCDGAQLLQTLLQLCQQVAPAVVVEGVEQVEDLHRLQAFGLPLWGQGYLWGRPNLQKPLRLLGPERKT